ncbi:Microcystin-dependent protein [Jatrophihabitans endophyticus]|uniref:Microcystin-dependent protein n=1 Tax=Jatrophihabitans endophyticus TaxID=1206085 RepID=A0A1M5KAL5_9ACTN|nr:tail fiber protein [Jatrophihabitans endophyticus]SHG49509.1 Microcystin-dependent protein [Jatrophihabitans endophyticus]
MTDPFLAEIRMFAGNYPPTGWALCNGQLMPISQNTALYSLLGNIYGGDGRTTFALPNLTGSSPMQQGQGSNLSQRVLGESGGEQSVTLLSSEMPAHTHTAMGVAAQGNTSSPAGATWAQSLNGRQGAKLYSTATPNTAMNPLSTQVAGSGQPHNNMPPYLCVTFIIALQGIFPPRP